MNNVIIHSYNALYKDAFHSINVDWINEFFFVTPGDEEILKNPERIIENGGQIFFAEYDNTLIGTCAMIQTGIRIFELAKMGILKPYRGIKAGEMLMQAAMNFARESGASKVYLETSEKLIPAIALYEKHGFKRVGEEYTHPLFGRWIFKMEVNLLATGF